MSVRDQLMSDLLAAPEDWRLRGVLADWCEDNDRPEEAACLRWMVRLKKRPYHAAAPKATWFNAATVAPGLGDPESDIPGEVYEHLQGGQVTANHMTFAELRDAEEAILAAWRKARKMGWQGGE